MALTSIDAPSNELSKLPLALSVLESGSGKLITLRLNIDTLAIENKRVKEIVYRQVIAADFNRDTQLLEVSYLDRRKQRASLSLVKVTGFVQYSEDATVSSWIETLMHISYEGFGVKRHRRLKVLINHFAGVGKGATIYTRKVEPIFKAARCYLDVIHTTHHGHAFDIAKALDLNYDAIVTVSGDGLIHEVMNGFANHEDPRTAFDTPIGPIPTGSGNALALNLLGFERGFDVAEAALNVIKGRPMKVDAFSLTQKGKRTISFMSQALGLMADLDIGTEQLRWMGDARFMVGLMRGLIQFRACPIQLSVKVAENDKKRMVQNFQTRRNEYGKSIPTPPPLSPVAKDTESSSLPPLKYSIDDMDGWITVDEPILYLYAGKGPYVSRSLMAFPASLPDDGMIDVTVRIVSSRKDILASVGGGPKGEAFWSSNLKYYKAYAYRVKPLGTKGVLSVDGENFLFEEFQVEVHPGLATLLSPHGYYAADFPPEPPSDRRSRKNTGTRK